MVRWYRRDGQVKVAGITICCLGAILMTFYKGPAVVGKHASTVGELYPAWLDKLFSSGPGFLGLPSSRHQLGALCLVGNCICYATYINLQVRISITLRSNELSELVLAYDLNAPSVLFQFRAMQIVGIPI